MKTIKCLFLSALCLATISAFGEPVDTRGKEGNPMEKDTIKLIVNNNKIFTAKLENNSSAKALRALLEKGDISIQMQDYANMEKVGPIGKILPRNDAQTTTAPCDLILYQGKYFVIYYAPNSWKFTRLGKIENTGAKELKSALGAGDATVILSIKP